MSEERLHISQRQARAWLIAGQGLTTPFASPEEAVQALFGVQTQYAASLGVAIATRVKRMKPAWSDAAFNKNPTLVKTWSLRSTLHAHLVEDRALLKAFCKPRYEQFLSWMKSFNMAPGQLLFREEEMLMALNKGPLTRPEIHDAVPELKSLDWSGWGADVKGLAYKGHVILAPSGPGQTRFVLAKQWLGSEPEDRFTYEEALAEILRRYLRSHAPASMTDFAYWAGIKSVSARGAFKSLEPDLIRVEIEKLAGTRFVLAQDAERLLQTTPASGVRLLAKFDSLLMAHRDKSLYLDHKHLKTVSQLAGQIEACVLIDGKVAGIWRLQRKVNSGQVSIQQFRPFNARETARLEKEVVRLSKALGVKEMSIDLDASHVTGR